MPLAPHRPDPARRELAPGDGAQQDGEQEHQQAVSRVLHLALHVLHLRSELRPRHKIGETVAVQALLDGFDLVFQGESQRDALGGRSGAVELGLEGRGRPLVLLVLFAQLLDLHVARGLAVLRHLRGGTRALLLVRLAARCRLLVVHERDERLVGVREVLERLRIVRTQELDHADALGRLLALGGPAELVDEADESTETLHRVPSGVTLGVVPVLGVCLGVKAHELLHVRHLLGQHALLGLKVFAHGRRDAMSIVLLAPHVVRGAGGRQAGLAAAAGVAGVQDRLQPDGDALGARLTAEHVAGSQFGAPHVAVLDHRLMLAGHTHEPVPDGVVERHVSLFLPEFLLRGPDGWSVDLGLLGELLQDGPSALGLRVFALLGVSEEGAGFG